MNPRFEANEILTQGPKTDRAVSDILIEPKDCALVLADQQAGLAFGVGSIDRQMFLNNVIALARTATVFGIQIVVSTSATKVYSGPLLPAIRAAIPEVVAIDRRNMNKQRTTLRAARSCRLDDGS
ncbi:hypothetical protein [Bradyrhizobium sp. SEMIA]|uniref:hypothetical protein n=1 Tax=Bradyrhizobium sp. SEMIA TaxID=2597515 RepID=UPI00223EFCA9|nr:hypothetical protein [Bradyrhizobium sp. SEMIA]